MRCPYQCFLPMLVHRHMRRKRRKTLHGMRARQSAITLFPEHLGLPSWFAQKLIPNAFIKNRHANGTILQQGFNRYAQLSPRKFDRKHRASTELQNDASLRSHTENPCSSTHQISVRFLESRLTNAGAGGVHNSLHRFCLLAKI